MTTTKTEFQTRLLRYNFFDGWSIPSTSVTYTNRPIWNNSRTVGDNLPNWKARIEAGKNATTSLVGSRRTLRFTPGVMSYESALGLQRIMTGIILNQADKAPAACSSIIESRASTAAAVQFSKRFRSKTRNWQSGVFFGEIFETARLLSGPVRHLRTEVTHLYSDLVRLTKRYKWRDVGELHTLERVSKLEKRKLARKREYLKALADTWLVWSFAVKPTISDANDACEAFRAVSSGRGFDMIRTTATSEYSERVNSLCFSSNSVNWSPVGYGGTVYSREVVDYSQVTYRGAWKNKTSNPNGEMPVPMRFGLDLSSIVPTAWEIIPWSFFVDYFTNIGDVLDAWSLMLVDFEWMNRTTRSRRTYIYSDPQPDPAPPSYAHNIQCEGGHAKVVRYDVVREPYASLWDSKFQVKLPGMGKRWLNIAALAAMRIPPR